MWRWTIVAVTVLTLAGCGDGGDDEAATGSPSITGSEVGLDGTGRGEDTVDGAGAEGPEEAGPELYPDVIGAEAQQGGDGTWTISATLSSPYDSPERYADAWRVVGPDGEVYGIRVLAHDHAGEQPFTRSQSGIVIPEGVSVVTIEGRDQLSGWGGTTVELELDR